MSDNFNTLDTEFGATHGTLNSYVSGFVLSILLTIAAYGLVIFHPFAASTMLSVVMLLALCQLCVQLFFFLHLSRKSHARWNVLALTFTSIIIGILVVGSLWVMRNLTDRTMNPMHGDGTINAHNAY